MNALLRLDGVGWTVDGSHVLAGVSAEFAAGELISVLGPNGAGKSTMLSICAGLRREFEGRCELDGRDVREWKRRDYTRRVGFVPQNLAMEFPFTAEQVVLMGRAPHGDGMFESAADFRAAEEALRRTDALAFRHRDFRTLSGGERQRVIVASALAQAPRVLLLDEPTAFLDLKHQVALYALLRDLSREGMLVIAVTHDVNLAAAHADRVMLLCGGRVAALGTTAGTLTEANLRCVFDVACRVVAGDEGRLWIRLG